MSCSVTCWLTCRIAGPSRAESGQDRGQETAARPRKEAAFGARSSHSPRAGGYKVAGARRRRSGLQSVGAKRSGTTRAATGAVAIGAGGGRALLPRPPTPPRARPRRQQRCPPPAPGLASARSAEPPAPPPPSSRRLGVRTLPPARQGGACWGSAAGGTATVPHGH